MASGMNPRAEAMGKMKKMPKEIEQMRVAEAQNGGHTAYHDHTDPMAHPPEGPHIFPAHAEKVPVMEGHLFHHMAKHLNIPHEVMGAAKEVAEEHEPAEGEEDEE